MNRWNKAKIKCLLVCNVLLLALNQQNCFHLSLLFAGFKFLFFMLLHVGVLPFQKCEQVSVTWAVTTEEKWDEQSPSCQHPSSQQERQLPTPYTTYRKTQHPEAPA